MTQTEIRDHAISEFRELAASKSLAAETVAKYVSQMQALDLRFWAINEENATNPRYGVPVILREMQIWATDPEYAATALEMSPALRSRR